MKIFRDLEKTYNLCNSRPRKLLGAVVLTSHLSPKAFSIQMYRTLRIQVYIEELQIIRGNICEVKRSTSRHKKLNILYEPVLASNRFHI